MPDAMVRATLRRRPVLGMLAGACLTTAPAGCATWPAPSVPMPVRRIAARCTMTERCVLLPGVFSRADEFVTEGFVADLQRVAPGCEVLLADAHLGYFAEGQLLRRLREDVVQPADAAPSTSKASRAGGATRLGDGDPALGTAGVAADSPAALPVRPWLVGISLGGLAALAYAMRHGSEIAGVLAIAPYLGRRELLRDISAAGGPLAWSRLPHTPGVPSEPHAAIEDDLWRWLARPGIGSSSVGPPIHLGYGRDDRFADAQRVLQALLPAGHTDVVAGGHDWPPWRALWQRWLQRGLLAGPSASTSASAASAGCAGAV
jgi:hypothetical protein